MLAEEARKVLARTSDTNEVRLTKTQVQGYRLFVEKTASLEQALELLKRQANEFLSECLREAGQEPGPDWRFDKNKVTFFRQESQQPAKE